VDFIAIAGGLAVVGPVFALVMAAAKSVQRQDEIKYKEMIVNGFLDYLDEDYDNV
jgi:hypothetical protein